MVCAPLVDPTNGANAKLAAMALDGADTRPEALVAFLKASDDDQAVTGTGVSDWPIAVVTCAQPADITWSAVKGPSLHAENLLASVALITRDTLDPAQAWRDTNYYLIACVNALMSGLFAATPSAADARRRGPVTIVRLNKLTYGATDYDVPGGRVTGAILLDLYVQFTPS
jgi:hypothetical protein